ncbi:hypothetical protein QZM52_18170 [Burkholderia metallica]|uniref:Lipoprotein n=1 Tax=Burkholderia metallica TaxID=488729 RepID=A0ABT8PFG2_9BURK|nr:hypothetical protein [Burkholderia metallica]MDN7933213.1 hypothetical protein [Burkholderia metallica]
MELTHRHRKLRWLVALILSLGATGTALAQGVPASTTSASESKTMPTLANLIKQEKWDNALQYCHDRRDAAIPEINAVLATPRLNGTLENFMYHCLRQIRTVGAAVRLAEGFNRGGRENVYGLIENPRPEAYPILKARLKSPQEEVDRDLLLTMAQMDVPVEQRVADIKPYLEAKYYGTRQGAVLGLALLDDPDSTERMVYELGTKYRQSKSNFLRVFYDFRAWRIPKFVPVLIPVLNDPMPLDDIGIRMYLPGGGEQSMTSEEERYSRARDYALNIIAKTLNLDLPFKIEDQTTYTQEQRDLVKQKLRNLGYTVTDEPYPITPA